MSHTDLLGKRWEANAQGPNSFDCWGLVRHWYRTRLDIELPASPVNALDLRAVVIELARASKSHVWEEVPFGSINQVIAMGKNGRISHVGIHIGGGYILHCTRECGGVIVQTFSQLQRRWSTLKIYRYKG